MMTRWKKELAAAIVLSNLTFLALAVWCYWPSWWLAVNSDRSPRAWFFSVQLAAIGFAAILCFYLSRLEKPRRSNVLWLLLGSGFLYLSLDKYFRIHENLRDRFFVPHDIGTRLPGITPGDIVPLFYATGGLLISWALVRKCGTRANGFLFGAVALAAIAVILDIGNFLGTPNETLRVLQFCEKMLQTGSQVLLLIFIVIQNCHLMEKLYERR